MRFPKLKNLLKPCGSGMQLPWLSSEFWDGCLFQYITSENPWYIPSKHIIFFLPVYALESLTAYITASVPELKKRILSIPGMISHTFLLPQFQVYFQVQKLSPHFEFVQ